MLIGPCLGTVSFEGDALWILYASPLPVARAIGRKARLWAVIGAGVAGAILAAGWVADPALSAARVADNVAVLAGVVAMAYVTTGLGVIGARPLAQEKARRLRQTAVWGALLLMAMFAWAVYAPTVQATLTMLGLVALVAYAVWQKAADAAPYMLDPVASPPPTLSLADGMITVFALFVVQGALAAMLIGVADLRPWAAVMIGYVGAAAVVIPITVCVLAWRGVPGLARQLGLTGRAKPAARAWWAKALGLGLATGGLAVAYQAFVLPHVEVPQGLWHGVAPAGHVAMGFVLVVVAPFAEELLFRGLAFGSLRRTLSLPVALVVGAALFAAVHPLLSAGPVFLLGLAAGWAFERTGRLHEPILVHVVYNLLAVAGLAFLA
jgi:membrane protease YdiL (CAAX protease family)